MPFLTNIKNSAKSLFNIGGGSPDFSSRLPSTPKDPETEDGAYSVKVLITRETPGKKDEKGNPIKVAENVVARLSESFKLSVRSEWESLSSGISGGLAKAADLTLGATLGYSLKTQILTAQYWSGNAPIEFTIPFQFKAFSNARKEVMTPLKTLMKASLPRTGDFNFLIPPGPNVLAASFDQLKTVGKEVFNKIVPDSVKNTLGYSQPENQSDLKNSWANITGVDKIEKGTSIDLYIGKFFHATNLIIVNVDCDIKTLMSNDDQPLPMSLDCSVTFRTMFAPTAEDIDKWFIQSK